MRRPQPGTLGAERHPNTPRPPALPRGNAAQSLRSGTVTAGPLRRETDRFSTSGASHQPNAGDRHCATSHLRVDGAEPIHVVSVTGKSPVAIQQSDLLQTVTQFQKGSLPCLTPSLVTPAWPTRLSM